MEDFLNSGEYDNDLRVMFMPYVYPLAVDTYCQSNRLSKEDLNLSQELRALIEEATIKPFYNKETLSFFDTFKPYSEKLNKLSKSLNIQTKKTTPTVKFDQVTFIKDAYTTLRDFNKSFHGSDRKNNFKSLRDWKTEQKKYHSGKQRLALRISTNTRKKLKELRKETGLSNSDLITALLLDLPLVERISKSGTYRLEIITTSRANIVQFLDHIYSKRIKLEKINEEALVSLLNKTNQTLAEIRRKVL
jgi:hypothetical protein